MSATKEGRVAEAEICETGFCDVGHVLIRGDHVSFVSVEQYERSGATKHVNDQGRVIWKPRSPKSDVVLPKGYVLVHDPSGNILSKCDLYLVRWHGRRQNGSIEEQDLPHFLVSEARKYYGDGVPIKFGSVDVPEGPWRRIPGRMRFIRYFRSGDQSDTYEHEFDPPVNLFDCSQPIAWRLPLPTGCVVDDRGFVWP